MGRGGQTSPPLPYSYPLRNTHTSLGRKGALSTHDPGRPGLRAQTLTSHHVSGDTSTNTLSFLTPLRTPGLGKNLHWDEGDREGAPSMPGRHSRVWRWRFTTSSFPFAAWPLRVWCAHFTHPGPPVWLQDGGLRLDNQNNFRGHARAQQKG